MRAGTKRAFSDEKSPPSMRMLSEAHTAEANVLLGVVRDLGCGLVAGAGGEDVKCEECEECGQELPEKPMHVYSVLLRVGSGQWRWMYSEPTTESNAVRETHELRATGNMTKVMTVAEAEREQAIWKRKRGKR